MKSLTAKIIFALVAGFVLGSALNLTGRPTWVDEWIINGLLDFGGQAFLTLLKLLVVPLVFVSLVLGTASLEDVRKLGRVGVKTMALYLFTTAAAITLAISLAVVIEPGRGLDLSTEAQFDPKPAPPLSQVLLNILPANPFKAMVDGEMLQIIFFAILFGISIALCRERGERVLHFFRDLDAVIMKMVSIVIELAPYGVFCLIAKVFALQGFAAILPLAKYFFLVLFALLVHGAVVYSGLLRVLAGLSPFHFIRQFRDVLVFAFSTSSSGSTIPVTLKAVTDRLGVAPPIASFTVPLGATINMDGTAIMQGVATVFIAQVYGVDIGITGYLTVVLTATLASIGTAGVPGVGLITLAMVLRQVNLPVEGIALIVGIDRLLDMVRTAVNVTGDAVVSCIVAKSEGQLDEKVFDSLER